MKTFLSYIPQQPEGNLHKSVYEPQGNLKLTYGATRFPILPVIHGYAKPGEEIHVICVVPEHENCKHNLVLFRQELEELCNDQNLLCPKIDVVSVPYDDDVSAQLKTFQQIVDRIHDGDDLHACITYGTKPSQMVELMALRYARQVKKNTFISCIVYGQYDHLAKVSKIYDETALVHLDDVMRVLAAAGITDVGQMLQRIIGM